MEGCSAHAILERFEDADKVGSSDNNRFLEREDALGIDTGYECAENTSQRSMCGLERPSAHEIDCGCVDAHKVT